MKLLTLLIRRLLACSASIAGDRPSTVTLTVQLNLAFHCTSCKCNFVLCFQCLKIYVRTCSLTIGWCTSNIGSAHISEVESSRRLQLVQTIIAKKTLLQASILYYSSDSVKTPDFVGYIERFKYEWERSVPAAHSLYGSLQVIETLRLLGRAERNTCSRPFL